MREVLRTPQFASIALTHFACCAAHSGPIFHMVSYAMDCGVPSMAAATVFGVAGLASLSGRIVCGLVADRVGAKRTLITGLAVQALAVSLYLVTQGATGFYALAALFGLSYGGVMPLYAILVREYFGAKIMGTAFGAVVMVSHSGHGDWSMGRRLAFRHVRQLLLAVYRFVRYRPRRRSNRVHLPPARTATGRTGNGGRHLKRQGVKRAIHAKFI